MTQGLFSVPLLALPVPLPHIPRPRGVAFSPQCTLANDGNPANAGKSGYKFAPVTVTATPYTFVTTAAPLGTTTGSKSYCSTDDGVVRQALSGVTTVVAGYAACQALNSLAN